jgi:curved DNA-binding protein CbpA
MTGFLNFWSVSCIRYPKKDSFKLREIRISHPDMQLKNYYDVLGIPPSATFTEIRAAYRKLAMQYHPDKNPGDSKAAIHFSEIKEAYEVLTNPSKKDYYLQQRWYQQSTGKKNRQVIFTPVTLLKQVLELDRYVSKLDIHRMDREGLYQYMAELMNDASIEKLNTFNDSSVDAEISRTILNCMDYLHFERVEAVAKQLMKIRNDEVTTRNIQNYVQRRNRSHRREKYTVWLILLTVISISLLIFFMSR